MSTTGPARTRTPRRAPAPLVTLLFALALIVAACGAGGRREQTQTPPPGSRAVSFESSDGVKIEGRLFGEGDVGVVLSHMLPADQTSWWDFAQTLAGRGYMALTYDFRGYCPGGAAGCSKGTKDVAAIWQDVMGAIRFLRSQGAVRIVLMGASMGGTASLIAAAEEGSGVRAVITLSAPMSIEGLVADAGVLTRITAAKLFVAGVGDPTGAADAAQQLYDRSPPPKRLEILPSNDHGTDLLTGSQGGILSTLMLGYVDQFSGP